MKYFTGFITLSILLLGSIHSSGQSPLLPRDASIKGPQTFGILMGVSKYKYVKQLAYADKDAVLFKEYLKSPGGGSVKEENIFMLLNENASNSNFWTKGFQWLKAKNLQRGDRLFIYLAGHGDAIDEDQFFFLGYDCNPKGDKNNYLVSGAIQLFNLKKKIAAETTKGVEVFFIMDACRSNELPGGISGQNFLNTAISEKKAGEIIMLATGAGQESLEDASIGSGQGLFTYYLVDGLTGVADSSVTMDQRVTFREIQAYVNRNVPTVAQQRFKRKQDPYFCCTENSDRVISRVDTAYLQKWLKLKKQQVRGPGNSFNGWTEPRERTAADTLLIETYDRFNRAVGNNNITGNNSAEEFYRQLQTKFPGNPYTLDAKSTLAVQYINVAQDKVDHYLGCSYETSAREKQSSYEAAVNLEKAIDLVREDDADFANSLYGRMYLLKSGGDFGNSGRNGDISLAFQYAHAALRIDPNGAYIMNKLALLHLDNNRGDSALYYADKATAIAPNWNCALTTLALVRNAMANNNPADTARKKKVNKKYKSPGITLGYGMTRMNPTYAENQGNVIGVGTRGGSILILGFIYQADIGKNIGVRPAVALTFDDANVVFTRRSATGGNMFTENIKSETIAFNVALPLIFRFTSNKKISPFISLGPSFSYSIGNDTAAQRQLPVKKSIFSGDAGLGIDIKLKKSGIVISPELKFSAGLTDLREPGSSVYSNSISALKKRVFSFTVNFRKPQ